MKTDRGNFQGRVGRTDPRQEVPRLPHERDEANDGPHYAPRDRILQAYCDLMSGQEDTDCREQRSLEAVVKPFLTSTSGKDVC